MKFLKLSVKNFMPYKGVQEIIFPSDSVRNVLVVFGDNMRGKTSLLNAIRWGMYGKAYSRHKALIGLEKIFNIEAVNEGDTEFSVEISFEAGGNTYELTRIAKKHQFIAKPERDSDFDVHVFLKKNGDALPGYQIESEINLYAPEQVSRFFLFDGELLQEYEMLLDEGNSKGQEIKDSIEQVLGVPALINGKHECLTLQRQAEKLQNKEISKIENMNRLAENQRILQERYDVKHRDLEASKQQLTNIRQEKNLLDDEIEALNKLSVTAAELSEKKNRQKSLSAQQSDLRVEILQLASGSWKDLLKPKLIEIEARLNDEILVSTNKIRKSGAISQEVSQIESLLSESVCPTCTQKIDNAHKETFSKKLAEVKGRLQELDENQHRISETTAQLTAIRRLLMSNVSERLKDKSNQIRNNEVELTRLENAIEKLYRDLEGKNADDVIKKRKRHDELIKSEQTLLNNIDLIDSDLLKIRKQIDDISKQIINANPATMKSRSTMLVNIYRQLEETFRNSIDTLRERLKSEVESKASEAFRELTTQKKYQGLSINSNYGLSILDESGSNVPLRSAGAEQIVALSLIDGLSRTGRASGPVVMDTPFGRLDPLHRENILRYLPENASQLILLVHDGEINRDEDLEIIAHRLGAAYEIKEQSMFYSKLEVQS